MHKFVWWWKSRMVLVWWKQRAADERTSEGENRKENYMKYTWTWENCGNWFCKNFQKAEHTHLEFVVGAAVLSSIQQIYLVSLFALFLPFSPTTAGFFSIHTRRVLDDAGELGVMCVSFIFILQGLFSRSRFSVFSFSVGLLLLALCYVWCDMKGCDVYNSEDFFFSHLHRLNCDILTFHSRSCDWSIWCLSSMLHFHCSLA